MKSVETPDYITEVGQAVNKAFDKEGYQDYPGYVQVKRWMRACQDEDWSSTETRKDNADEVVQNALRWAEEKGLPRKGRPEPTISKDLSWTGVGLALETVSRVQARVEAVRAEFWGVSKPPFETSPEGQEDALEWVQQAEKEDAAALKGKRPGWVTLSITLEADDVGGTLDALESLIRELHTLKAVAAVLARTEADIATNDSGGQNLTLGIQGRALEPLDAKGWTYPTPVFRGTRLARLAERVDEVCNTSGWWSKAEALAFIMCGLIPPAAVRTKFTRRDGGHKEIEMKVIAPTTARAISEVYQRTLDRHRLNPKSLSDTYQAVLKLFYDTPGLSWPNRYKRWLELSDQRPELPRLSGPGALGKTCKRAMERASWGSNG